MDLSDLLPDGAVLLGFAASVKFLDSNGEVTLVNVRSEDISAWEAVGMLTSGLDDFRARMQHIEE